MSGGPPPARGSRRNADGTFRVLCDWLVWHGRTRQTNAALEAQLCGLDREVWYVERDLSIAKVRIPFLLLGESGIFLLRASRGYWANRDISELCRAADALGHALPGYPDAVNCGIVMLDEAMDHRQHFAADGEGPCWLVAGENLIEWLYAFDHRGLSRADVTFVREWASASRSTEPRRVFIPAGCDEPPDPASSR